MKRRSISAVADRCLLSWKFPVSAAITGCVLWMAAVLCVLAVYSFTHTGSGAQHGFFELLWRLEKTNVIFIRSVLVIFALCIICQLFKRQWNPLSQRLSAPCLCQLWGRPRSTGFIMDGD